MHKFNKVVVASNIVVNLAILGLAGYELYKMVRSYKRVQVVVVNEEYIRQLQQEKWSK